MVLLNSVEYRGKIFCLIHQQGKYGRIHLGYLLQNVSCIGMWVDFLHSCISMFQGNKGTEKHLFVAYIKTNCTADSLKILCELIFYIQQQHLFPSFQDQQLALEMDTESIREKALLFGKSINSLHHFFQSRSRLNGIYGKLTGDQFKGETSVGVDLIFTFRN